MQRRISTRWFSALVLLALLFGAVPPLAQAQEGGPDEPIFEQDEDVYHGTYYVQDRLNAGLRARDMSEELLTPQAALEYFVLAAREERFHDAAYALNMNLLPLERQSEQAGTLAEHLYYLLQQHALIDWDSLPDRPDGQIDTSSSQNKNPLVGTPRRNIRLGDIALDGRDVPVRIQRVKVGDQPPVWVFSASTVENIEPLYDVYEPGILARYAPEWTKFEIAGGVLLWEWAALLVLFLISAALAFLVHYVLVNVFRKLSHFWWRGIIDTTATPLATVLGLAVFLTLISRLLSLTGPITRFLDYTVFILLIVASTWLVMRGIKFVTDYVVEQHVLNESERNIGRARERATHLFVWRRVVLLVALLGGIALFLDALDIFGDLSMSLLASAGVFTVVFGIAGQRFLGDIIAGMQIAITQPVRVGDTVDFEGAWGTVERITYTYLTIYTWDQRRVMVPLQYFLSHTVENLTKTSANLIKPIYLYLDYYTDVEQVRQIFTELLEQDEDWDQTLPPNVSVTNITDEAMEVRLLCSANTPEKAWSLRFRLTEQMMARLRGLEADHHLPKQRLVIERSAGRERSTNGRVTGQATEHDRASDGGEAEQAGA
jgi:small-conductance mechanosensitive channel